MGFEAVPLVQISALESPQWRILFGLDPSAAFVGAGGCVRAAKNRLSVRTCAAHSGRTSRGDLRGVFGNHAIEKFRCTLGMSCSRENGTVGRGLARFPALRLPTSDIRQSARIAKPVPWNLTPETWLVVMLVSMLTAWTAVPGTTLPVGSVI